MSSEEVKYFLSNLFNRQHNNMSRSSSYGQPKQHKKHNPCARSKERHGAQVFDLNVAHTSPSRPMT